MIVKILKDTYWIQGKGYAKSEAGYSSDIQLNRIPSQDVARATKLVEGKKYNVGADYKIMFHRGLAGVIKNSTDEDGKPVEVIHVKKNKPAPSSPSKPAEKPKPKKPAANKKPKIINSKK